MQTGFELFCFPLFFDTFSAWYGLSHAQNRHSDFECSISYVIEKKWRASEHEDENFPTWCIRITIM